MAESTTKATFNLAVDRKLFVAAAAVYLAAKLAGISKSDRGATDNAAKMAKQLADDLEQLGEAPWLDTGTGDRTFDADQDWVCSHCGLETPAEANLDVCFTCGKKRGF